MTKDSPFDPATMEEITECWIHFRGKQPTIDEIRAHIALKGYYKAKPAMVLWYLKASAIETQYFMACRIVGKMPYDSLPTSSMISSAIEKIKAELSDPSLAKTIEKELSQAPSHIITSSQVGDVAKLLNKDRLKNLDKLNRVTVEEVQKVWGLLKDARLPPFPPPNWNMA